jgi:hypothetical protein
VGTRQLISHQDIRGRGRTDSRDLSGPFSRDAQKRHPGPIEPRQHIAVAPSLQRQHPRGSGSVGPPSGSSVEPKMGDRWGTQSNLTHPGGPSNNDSNNNNRGVGLPRRSNGMPGGGGPLSRNDERGELRGPGAVIGTSVPVTRGSEREDEASRKRQKK